MLVYEVNGGESLVAVCIRGDLTVNEIKLRALLGAQSVAIPDDGALRKVFSSHRIPRPVQL